MPEVLLSPREWTLITSTACTIQLASFPGCFVGSYLTVCPNYCTCMWCHILLISLFAHSKFSEFYIVRKLVPANDSDLNVESVNVRVGFGAYMVYAVHGGGVGWARWWHSCRLFTDCDPVTAIGIHCVSLMGGTTPWATKWTLCGFNVNMSPVWRLDKSLLCEALHCLL